MMYRPQYDASFRDKCSRGKHKTKAWFCVFGVSVVAIALYAFVWVKDANQPTANENQIDNQNESVLHDSVAPFNAKVYRNRLLRSEIPEISFANVSYREAFNDSNYMQLTAARACGIDPATVDDPAEHQGLVPIFSTALYRVDTMYHAAPYLVPEASLLLNYIAQRFDQLMTEEFPHKGKHRIIVTSALRTENSERRLRRVNRNATDTSCHIYGTTFDISAQRYEHSSGCDTVVEYCKMALAKALYELRYEGLCYVKYERGSCFHITLRTTQYEGKGKSQLCSYVNPGSPEYLKTKAIPRPTPSPQSVRGAIRSRHSTPPKTPVCGAIRSRHSTRPAKTSDYTQEAKSQGKTMPYQEQGITDRERLSLDHFEKRLP